MEQPQFIFKTILPPGYQAFFDSLMDSSFKNVKAVLEATPYNLMVKHSEKLGLYTVVYDQVRSKMDDLLVQESRGIIFELDTNRLVCMPFKKFFNYGQVEADQIDWSTAQVQEKEDGSLIKMFWYRDQWRVATNSSLTADHPGNDDLSYLEMVKDAAASHGVVDLLEYANQHFDRTHIHMFELNHPKNIIVVRHSKPKLVYLGSRCMKTLKETNLDMVFPVPKRYSLSNVKDTQMLVNAFGHDQEGVVVVDAMYRRVKIKSDVYLELSNCVLPVTEKGFLKLILEKKDDDVVAKYPYLAREFMDVKTKLSKVADLVVEVWSNDNSLPRKELARKYRSEPYFAVLMKVIGKSDLNSGEVIRALMQQRLNVVANMLEKLRM